MRRLRSKRWSRPDTPGRANPTEPTPIERSTAGARPDHRRPWALSLSARPKAADPSIVLPWILTAEPHCACSATRSPPLSSPPAEPPRPGRPCATTAQASPANNSSPWDGARPDNTTVGPCTCADAIASNSSVWAHPTDRSAAGRPEHEKRRPTARQSRRSQILVPIRLPVRSRSPPEPTASPNGRP